MVDYVQILLNGAATGMGVLLANKVWQKIEDHMDRLRGLR